MLHIDSATEDVTVTADTEVVDAIFGDGVAELH